jgi:hypothetical protein
MDDMEEKEASFPELPSYEALWVPVYWEPVLLSGERICAIVAVLGHNGEILVQPIIRPNVVKILYPKKHTEATGLVNWIVDSLREHLVSGGDFSEWLPPITGFHLGAIRSSVSCSIEGILNQALPLCSSLSNPELATIAPVSCTIEMSQERWRATIKERVLTSLPRLETSFGRAFTVVEGARQTKIDFVGQKLASNFARLASSQLSRCVRDSKAQMLDLAALRDSPDLFERNDKYKLMIWRPFSSLNEECGIPVNKMNLINEAFLELEGEGNRLDLEVSGYCDPLLAATEICQIEVAA